MDSEKDNETLGDLTLLLRKARSGDNDARQAVLPRVYDQLLACARSKMRNQLEHHTLQPTALVHEAYLRSLGREEGFENRRHFFFIAAQAMRDILVEHARRKAAIKRGGDQDRIDIDDVVLAIEPPSVDVFGAARCSERARDRAPPTP